MHLSLIHISFASIFLALCAELGTFLTVPIAAALGLTLKESASVAMVGGADAVSYTHLDVYKRQVVLFSCGESHFLKEEAYRNQVFQDFEQKQSCLLYTSRCV